MLIRSFEFGSKLAKMVSGETESNYGHKSLPKECNGACDHSWLTMFLGNAPLTDYFGSDCLSSVWKASCMIKHYFNDNSKAAFALPNTDERNH